MPTLYVLGGANGVGKTTWYQLGIENKSIDPDLPFVNIDLIVLRELNGYTAENLAKAELIARERMRVLLQERKDFMIESNLSKSFDYDWIGSMRRNGYDTVLFFLGTNDVEINKNRVKARILEGGHAVADPIIEQRYQTGLSYLKSKVLDFSEATIVDVSGHQPCIMAQLRQGHIVFKDPYCLPWVQASLELAERIALRKGS
jgi:predicted ABC-type ATPase